MNFRYCFSLKHATLTKGGLIDTRRMNEADFQIADGWADDGQAMIRAYADQNDLGWPPELMQQWPSNLHQRRWEVCWLTAMRYGMEKAIAECPTQKDDPQGNYDIGFNDGILCYTDAITAAMPAKEGE